MSIDRLVMIGMCFIPLRVIGASACDDVRVHLRPLLVSAYACIDVPACVCTLSRVCITTYVSVLFWAVTSMRGVDSTQTMLSNPPYCTRKMGCHASSKAPHKACAGVCYRFRVLRDYRAVQKGEKAVRNCNHSHMPSVAPMRGYRGLSLARSY